MSEERCICCGAIIPEGRQVCPNCMVCVNLPEEERCAEATNEATKHRTHFAKIIVEGTAEKPYYNILYFDPTDKEYHIGFGSYYLKYVFQWLKEEFEIVGDAFFNEPVVRCKDCKHMEVTPDELRWCNAWGGINGMGDDGFCNYGERKQDGK